MIKILFADDSPDDVDQCIKILRQAKQTLKTHRVEDAAGFEAALSSGDWDIVLAKHVASRLNARQVLAMLKARHTDIPLIVLASTIADADLHEVMAAGAGDVIAKGQWARLLPALQREMRAAEERRGMAHVTESLRQLEDRYRVMIEGSREAVCYCHDGMYVDANPAYLTLVGYHDLDELKGVPILNLIDKNDQNRFKLQLRSPDAFSDSREYTAVTNTAVRLPVEIVMSAVKIEGESCVQIVVTDISKRRALENKLQFLHQRDALTGLCNRPYFLQELGKAIEQVRVDKGSCFLLGLELRQMAEINKTFGYAACDRLLLMLTRQLSEHLTEQQLFGRVGGGQFSVLLCDATRGAAEGLTATLRQTTAAFQFADGVKRFDFRFDLNLVEIDKTIDDRQHLLSLAFRHAEPTLEPSHASQTQASTTIVEPPPVATAVPIPDSPAVLETLPDAAHDAVLQEALSQERYRLMFQPLINLHGEPREYYEACLFVQTQAGELVAGATFMPLAQQMGQASKIDRWVVQQAIEALVKSTRQGTKAEVFIPLSASAVNDQMLLPAIQQHLKATRLNPAKLYFQIGTSILKTHEAAARAFLQQAKKMGAGIALDDFSPKLVSVTELTDLPIDVVKINCSTPPGLDEATLRRAAHDAKASGKTSVAKGVEDMGVFTLLWNCDFDYVQGTSINPPGEGMNHNFESETTLTSDQPLANPWQASG